MNKVKELFGKLRDLFSAPSHSRTLALLGIVLLVIIIPVTVIFLAQRTNLQQSAHFADCPIIEQKCGNNVDTKSLCTNASSFVATDMVNIETDVNCRPRPCVLFSHNSTTCGYKPPAPKCPSGVPSGSFCSPTGTCRAEPGYRIGPSCGGGFICCEPPAPTAKPTEIPSSNCEAPNHTYTNAAGKTATTKNGMCEKYECANGQISIGGACATGDSTCCLSASEYGATPKYTCMSGGNAFSGTDGSVTYCDSGKACVSGSSWSTNSGASDAKSHLCLFSTSSCEVKGGSCEKYQCGNGQVTMSGSCTIPDSVCCKGGTPNYTCSSDGTWISGTDGSVTDCDAGYSCSKSKYTTSGGYPSGSGPNSAKSQLCIKTTYACDTDLGTTPNNGFKNKATGVHQYCASNEYCTNAKTVGYPCAKIPASWVCVTHNGSSICDAKAAGGYCDIGQASQKPTCKAGYVLSPVNSHNDYKWNCYDATGSVVYTDYSCLPLATSAQCGNFGGACKLRSAGCYQGATLPYDCGDAFLTCCQSGKDAGTCTANSDCSSNQTCAGGKCIATTNTCTGNKGKCQATHTDCPTGYSRNLSLDTTCGTSTASNEICCTPNSSGGGNNGGGNNGGGNPTATPIPCTNGQATQLALNLKLDGIGTGSFENNTPAHTSRTGIYVNVTDQNNAAVTVPNSTNIQFTYTHGTFNSPTINLGTALSCGHTYSVTVKIPQYIPVKATVAYGKSNVIALSPIAGDINKVNLTTKVIVGDDLVSILDYNIIRDCHTDPTTPKTFTDNTNTVTLLCSDLMNFIDYSDGGVTGDEWSYNYNVWVRGYLKANGY